MQIYIAEGTQQTGPFDLETIQAGVRAGRYRPAQLAWYEGAPGWEPISRLPGMAAAVPLPPPLPAPPGTDAAPPPPAFIPVVSAPYVPGPGSGPPKKGVWATLGGICLGLLAVLLGLARIAHVFLPHGSPSSSPSYASTPAPGPPATAPSFFHSAPPAGGTRHFTNDRSKYGGNLAAHFVAFSFDYPEGWTLQENTEDSYVALKHSVRLPNGKNVQAEYVSFSYAYNQPGYAMSSTLDATGPILLGMMAEPIVKDSAMATKSQARAGQFGKYAAEELLVTDRTSDNRTGLYTRLLVVAQPNSSNDGLGVSFIGSELAGCKSADDLGESGGLRTIRDSFRFGP